MKDEEKAEAGASIALACAARPESGEKFLIASQLIV
jgi:hypothetical protein